MEISNRTKLGALLLLVTLFVAGLTLGGPYFIHKMQMHFGAKGKLELIERCIETPGCAISTNELELLDKLRALQDSDAVDKLKDSDLGEQLEQVDQSTQSESE